MRYALIFALILPYASEGFSFEPGFIIEAADPVVAEADPKCPCKCPCEQGKPCDCGDKCKCKDCPGKNTTKYGYKEARLDAIRLRTNLTVWVGLQMPTLLGRGGLHVSEPLGWIDPWGNRTTAPCRMDFYFEGGKIWHQQTVYARSAPAPRRVVFSSNC